MILNWNVSEEDQGFITRIAHRAHEMAKRLGMRGKYGYSPRDAAMDVTAVHANTMPLRLNELLGADDANFAHDVFGIRAHLNRDNGTLGHCFVPRYRA